MKKITCQQMGGPCNTVFTGNSTGEIAAQAEKHISEMAKADPAHQATYDEMAMIAAAPESHKVWEEEFQKMFDEAEEA